MSKLPNKGKLLALDLGTKVTGVAISDNGQRVAFPREEIFHSDETELLSAVKLLVKDEKISGVLLGLPVGWNGEDSHQTTWVRSIAEKLSEFIATEFIDESLSSQEIEGVARMKRQDSEVAMMLLSQCLDSR